MFESHNLPKALDEALFNRWLENGRMSKLGYHYMLVIWDDFEAAYQPVYLESRDDIVRYKNESIRERMIAAYDLFSESRIL